MRMKLQIITLIIGLITSCNIFAQNVSFEQAKKMAERGDAAGCRILGYLYLIGEGTHRDTVQALKWVEKGAERGDVPANFLLGEMYEYGYGVRQNFSKALSYFKISAEKGYPGSFSRIGNFYKDGLGVPKDISKAINWFKRGVEHKEGSSCLNLGVLYQNGIGVPQSDEEAFKYYKMAADNGNAMGYNNLANSYLLGSGVDKDLNEALMLVNKALEIDTFPEALDTKGEVSYLLGDKKEALNCFKKALSYFPQYYANLNLYSIEGEDEIYSRLQQYLAQDSLDIKVMDNFTDYARYKIPIQLKEWAKKDEFETTSQWKDRVNDISLKKEQDILLNSAKKDFVKCKAPQSISGSLGVYDADQNAFPVRTSLGNTIYVNVPLSDAPKFKQQWKNVKMQPTYGIINDTIGMISCNFYLGAKSYSLTQNYKEDSNQDLVLNIPTIDIRTLEHEKEIDTQNPNTIEIDKSLDENIPVTNKKSTKTFAFIIGNEDYQRVEKVKFAINDAEAFSSYCNKTLGIPNSNIRIYKNATYGTILAAINDIQNIGKAYKGDLDIIFYYAGHGVPNEVDKSAYLLPIDIDGTQTEACLSVKKLYQDLGSTAARQVIVIMDACFSGAQRGGGMLAASRGIALKVKEDTPTGNTIALTAATGDQAAYPYEEKGHGIFTYYLLKKLQESKGDASLKDIFDYVSDNVAKQSAVVNKHIQTPTIIPSANIESKWENWKLY